MNISDYMINCLHKLYREDNWIKELFSVTGHNIDNVDTKLNQVYDNNFFDTLDENACKVLEKDLGIKDVKSTLKQRRDIISAKWLASAFCSLKIIQQLADNYDKDCIGVDYDGDATLIYNLKHNKSGQTWQDFINAVDIIKPAHFDYICNMVFRNYKLDESGKETDEIETLDLFVGQVPIMSGIKSIGLQKPQNHIIDGFVGVAEIKSGTKKIMLSIPIKFLSKTYVGTIHKFYGKKKIGGIK